jgi:hypothetical protein
MEFNKYWFKPKKFGYGAYPSTWEGWLTTIGFIGLILYVALNIPDDNPNFYPIFIFSIIAFIFLVKKKTDGDWKWNWGKEKIIK